MPAATGVAPALRAARDARRYDEGDASVVAAGERERALALELRGPSGAVIETEYVAIIDTHYLLSIPPSIDEDEPLSEELQAEVDAMVEEILEDREPEEPWRQQEEETEFPRYQIQIRLLDPEMFLP